MAKGTKREREIEARMRDRAADRHILLEAHNRIANEVSSDDEALANASVKALLWSSIEADCLDDDDIKAAHAAASTAQRWATLAAQLGRKNRSNVWRQKIGLE